MTAQQIWEREFKKNLFGYNCNAVDQFLDEVIKDYSFFLVELEQLITENNALKKQLQKQKSTINEFKHSIGKLNYDIIKRLSSLEKKVFQDRMRG
ncbi:cell cycle protein GpsB [Pullulanibacillus camelliae]|uniref:Cell cycle protein GpsB n=1 Tax=Pullulanibacillus camelliae TaxID=1707096 RepID=A0A8J2YNB7_9BACL|nr:DivIVA domain-containing protein [Pullulanibacillus camelliae]GGE55846.1 cell cycle protein GpsB [Pullulanibacillus camelliae]